MHWFDGYLRRRSIAAGGGWWDKLLGVSHTSYYTNERDGVPGSAYAGSMFYKTPPAGFENVVSGVGGPGIYAVESGLRTGDGTAVVWWANNSAQPAMICKS